MKAVTLLVALVLLLDTSGFVRDGGAELVFPQAARFSANLTIPADEVTASTLSLSANGWGGATVEVDVMAALLNPDEPEARLLYEWRFSPDDLPPLFADLQYRWEFVSADGETGTLEGMLTFANPRAEWVESPDPAGHLSITLPRALSLDTAALRDVYALLRENTGIARRYNLFVAPFALGCERRADGVLVARSAVTDYETICDEGIDDVIYAGYQRVEISPNPDANLAVISWLVDDGYAPFWRGKHMPGWFRVGLTRFYAPMLKNPFLPPVQQAARSRALLSLDAMAQAPDDALQNSALWAAQSYGMLLYIVDRAGTQGLYELARSDASDFETAYRAVTGQPLSGLLPAFSQWIFTQSAERAFGITPYQPPTHTPLPTAAPTNTPPTPTQPAPPTATLMPSVTPRGLRTYIPPPTITPSETFTPPPPTVTPRPPGSLLDAPESPDGIQSLQPAVQGIIVVLLVLLLLLFVFLFIRLGNRR